MEKIEWKVLLKTLRDPISWALLKYTSSDQYKEDSIGNCKAWGDANFRAILKKSISLIKVADPTLYDDLVQRKMIFIGPVRGVTCPWELKRRYGIEQSEINKGVEKVAAAIIKSYFVDRELDDVGRIKRSLFPRMPTAAWRNASRWMRKHNFCPSCAKKLEKIADKWNKFYEKR